MDKTAAMTGLHDVSATRAEQHVEKDLFPPEPGGGHGDPGTSTGGHAHEDGGGPAADEPLSQPARSRLARRRRAVLAVAAAAALLSVGGLGGAMLVKSPAQMAADARAPKASVLTAQVISRRLADTVVLRGDFTNGKPLSVTPTSIPATASLYGETNPGGGTPIVTRVLTHVGQRVRAATPLVEVSGRPVYLLPGATPVYRDMLPGETGGDIAEFQNAVRRLGYYHGGDPRGYFGAATKKAVTLLYRAMDYPVPITGTDTQQAVQHAKATLAQLRGEEQVQAGRTDEGSTASSGTTSVTAPGTASSSNGPAVTSSTTGTTETPTRQSKSMRNQLADAQRALGTAEAQDGPMVPASEVAFAPALPARVTALPTPVGSKVSGPVVTLATGDLHLTGYLDPGQGGIVKPGMKVAIVSEDLGISAGGTAASVGALVTPGDQDTSGSPSGATGAGGGAQATVNGGVPYLPLEVVSGRPWPSRFAGQNVRITITAAATRSAVLTVPEAAIGSGADAKTTVTVLRTDGSQHQVEITAGVSAGGNVEISPVRRGALRAGDRVVIGQ